MNKYFKTISDSVQEEYLESELAIETYGFYHALFPLANHKTYCVTLSQTDIASALKLSGQRVSRYLSKLLLAGWIKYKSKRGNRQPRPIQLLKGWWDLDKHEIDEVEQVPGQEGYEKIVHDTPLPSQFPSTSAPLPHIEGVRCGSGLEVVRNPIAETHVPSGDSAGDIIYHNSKDNKENLAGSTPHPSSSSPTQVKDIDEQKSFQDTPNRILWTDMPEYTVVNAGIDGKVLTAVIDGERYVVTDNRTQIHQGTTAGGESADVQVSKGAGEQEEKGKGAGEQVSNSVEEQTNSSAHLLIRSSAQNQAGSDDEEKVERDGVDDEMEAEHDGVDCECDIMVMCPQCDSPLVYQSGRVGCIECSWSFGYRKFKRRFLGDEGKMARWQEGKMEGEEDRIPNPTASPPDRLASSPEYDDSVSTGEAADNRGVLSELLNGMATPQVATEGLVGGMVGDVDPNRIANATTKLSGGLGDNGDGNADEGNGQVVKRSKEETLRLLRRMDLSARGDPG